MGLWLPLGLVSRLEFRLLSSLSFPSEQRIKQDGRLRMHRQGHVIDRYVVCVLDPTKYRLLILLEIFLNQLCQMRSFPFAPCFDNRMLQHLSLLLW